MCYIVTARQLSVLHVIVYTCRCYFLHSPHSPLPLVCAQVCSLYLHLLSFPANRFINTTFSRFHVYVLTYAVCFSLSDLLHSVITGSRFIHLSRTDSNLSFFLIVKWYSTVYTCHLFIHSSLHCYLVCVPVQATVNSAAMNTGLHVSFSVIRFFDADYFFKVFTEFVTTLLLFYSWFFDPETCKIVAPQPGIKATPLTRQCLNHRTTREVPSCSTFNDKSTYFPPNFLRNNSSS